jgi:hypothetical protein
VQNKEAFRIIGAKISLQREKTPKCIPLLTECRPLRKGQQAIDGEMELHGSSNARYLLRKFVGCTGHHQLKLVILCQTSAINTNVLKFS